LTSSLTAVDNYVYIYSHPLLCVPELDWDSISDSVSMGSNGGCWNESIVHLNLKGHHCVNDNVANPCASAPRI